MISRIDHISIAVKDMDSAKKFFVDLFGAVAGSGATDENMKFSWEIFSLGDLSRIELITPTDEGSFLDNFLKDRESGVHHITLEVPDIEKAKEKLNKNNIPFFEGNDYGDAWKEIFIHPKDAFGVLIQLAEFKPEDWISDKVKIPGNARWIITKNENGCFIDLAHPGGGKVQLKLSSDEIKKIIGDLQKVI